jgi:hypothetical protein
VTGLRAVTATTGIPAWFKGPKPKRDPLRYQCGKCGAPPGERCRYTTGTGIHIDPATGRYAENVVGERMQRSHKGR